MSCFLSSVEIRNYKSIAFCRVDLGPLTLIVGPNGAGKSNFLDAIEFLADAARTTLSDAMQKHGGTDAVFFRGLDTTDALALVIEFAIFDRGSGAYSIELDRKGASFSIKRQWFSFSSHDERESPSFDIEHCAGHAAVIGTTDEQVRRSLEEGLSSNATGELIFNWARFQGIDGIDEFRLGLRDALFYDFQIDRLKSPEKPAAPQRLLQRDGRNLPSVVARMQNDVTQVHIKERVEEHLAAIVPTIAGFRAIRTDHDDALEFDVRVNEKGDVLTHPAGSISSGTLFAIASLVAQRQFGLGASGTVVGIEEPDRALHPGAVAALMGALREVSDATQVLITTHSPDFLDCLDPHHDTLLVTRMKNGRTEIGPADRASARMIREQLTSAGELLRHDHLEPWPIQMGGSTSAEVTP